MSKNDKAWEFLFNKHQILDSINLTGQFIITADQIKDTSREPRLMAKADTSESLPIIFKENNLGILPISRNSYIISSLNAYQDIEPLSGPITHVVLPDFIQSLQPNNINSESIALNTALATKILSDFLDEDNLFATVSGRMSSGKFNFKIQDKVTKQYHKIEVENSQIEIDMALEGAKSLSLIEAKLLTFSNFLIRQVYYPFRTWKNKLEKCIRNVFFVYSNGIFSLYEYAFDDVYNYNSLYLVRGARYSIEDTQITGPEVDKFISSIVYVPEPSIPFPQADKFDRVVDLCFILLQRDLDLEEITEEYDFDIRQASYYSSAAMYLGLVEKTNNAGSTQFRLTSSGSKIFNLDYKRRQLSLIKLILQHKVFHDVYKLTLLKNSLISINEIVEVMKSNNLYNMESDETYRRRAQTIRSWIGWVLGKIES